jgi:hypothetical protein
VLAREHHPELFEGAKQGSYPIVTSVTTETCADWRAEDMASDEAEPDQGSLPTNQGQPGEVIVDEHQLQNQGGL